MVQDIIIPNLGLTMEEAAIVEWRKQEGEVVAKGAVVLVLETDKCMFDVEAPQDGYLHIQGTAGHVYPRLAVVGCVAGSKPEYDLRVAQR